MDKLKCGLCGKEFKNKAGLGGHRVALHGEKKPTLGETVRDGLAGLSQRLSVIEGRVKGLESRPLPMLADPVGTFYQKGQRANVTPEAVGQALLDLLGPELDGDHRRVYPPPGSIQSRLISRLEDKFKYWLTVNESK